MAQWMRVSHLNNILTLADSVGERFTFEVIIRY